MTESSASSEAVIQWVQVDALPGGESHPSAGTLQITPLDMPSLALRTSGMSPTWRGETSVVGTCRWTEVAVDMDRCIGETRTTCHRR